MRWAMWAAGFAVLTWAAGFGQAPDKLTFEVASVKPSPQPKPGERLFFGPPRGGPGTGDPARITWERAALLNVLMVAYDVPLFQISGPDWLRGARFDIVANVPAGATKEQVNVMWQNLLKERFGMTVHHESKEFQADELTVAKGGPKLKPTDLGPNPEPFAPPPGPPPRDKSGLPEMNGYGAVVMLSPNPPTAKMIAKALTLADLASRLGQQLRHPVIDKTGIEGRYDFTLEYSADLSGMMLPPPIGGEGPPRAALAPGDSASEPGTNVASALEKQLGLKLGRGKAKLDVIVVDHMEKVPTEN